MESYKQYLHKFLGMSVADADLFLSGFEQVDYKKGDFLLKEGEPCNVIRIVLNGCARGFVIDDGKDVTTNFYFENDHSYDYVNYLLNTR